MKHTQEKLADVLNRQRQRGIEDAQTHRDYGHSNECKAFPNPTYPDITEQAAQDAYDQGWAFQRVRMNKPDTITAAVLGKGVRHRLT